MHDETTTEIHGLKKKIQSMALDSIANETQLQETVGDLHEDLRIVREKLKDFELDLVEANEKIETLTSERNKLADLLEEWVILANRLKI